MHHDRDKCEAPAEYKKDRLRPQSLRMDAENRQKIYLSDICATNLHYSRVPIALILGLAYVRHDYPITQYFLLFLFSFLVVIHQLCNLACGIIRYWRTSLKVNCRKYPAIHTNYSLSNCTISN